MTPQQKVQFFSKLATLLNSGFSLQDSLESLAKDHEPRIARSLTKISVALSLGEDVASAFAHAPRYFDQWTIGLMQVADDQGTLPEMCQRLARVAQQQQQRQSFYRSLKVAILTTGVSVLGLVITLLYTHKSPIVIWVLLIILLIILGLVAPDMTPRLPLIRQIYTARSMLYLAELELPLNCGIPILTAIEWVRDRIPKSEMSATLSVALGQMPAGHTLSQSLDGRLPMIAVRMIRAGEETGNLNLALHKLADYYNQELERTLRLLQGILVPVSLLAAVGLVAVLAMEALKSLLILLPD